MCLYQKMVYASTEFICDGYLFYGWSPAPELVLWVHGLKVQTAWNDGLFLFPLWHEELEK